MSSIRVKGRLRAETEQPHIFRVANALRKKQAIRSSRPRNRTLFASADLDADIRPLPIGQGAPKRKANVNAGPNGSAGRDE